jgi:3-hydroxyisobutyrate dehydrogenase
MTRILFIGLGNMGLPMALNLVKAGHHVSGFYLADEALRKFTGGGGIPCSSLSVDAREADVVITMLPSGKVVWNVLHEKNALFTHAREGTLFIDSSTIESDISRDLADMAAKRKLQFLDAPVSGGTAGAAQGTLTFMVGGSAASLERAHPLLSSMGKNIFHAGGAGAGQVAKVCNNMLLATHMVGTAEALNLGVSLGLDAKVLSEIMSKSSGCNWSLTHYNPYPGVMENAPASRNYSGGFAVDLMNKDLGLAIASASKSRVPVPMGQTAFVLYKTYAPSGGGSLDFSSIIHFLNPESKESLS